MADNQLCGLNKYGQGTYTSAGIPKLCEGIKGSAITSLKCAIAPFRECLLSCQGPLTEKRNAFCARSLEYNDLGPKGGAAMAEGLKGNATLQSLK